MKSSIPLLTTAIFAALSTLPANALTLNRSYGGWTAVTGGSNHSDWNYQNGYYYDNQSTVGENQVRWGIPASGDASQFWLQSGLGFQGVGTTIFDAGETFQIGTLRHFNNPITNAASAASLSIYLDFAGLGVKSFDFTLNIDETPNSGVCPYYSVTPCSDKISWANSFGSQTFFNDGIEYTLELLGFSASPGSTIVTDFLSQEGGTSQAFLYGKLTALTPPPPPPPPILPPPVLPPDPPTGVPEPSTIAGLLLIGLSTSIWRDRGH